MSSFSSVAAISDTLKCHFPSGFLVSIPLRKITYSRIDWDWGYSFNASTRWAGNLMNHWRGAPLFSSSICLAIQIAGHPGGHVDDAGKATTKDDPELFS
ncbi:MAG: hypothetical protein AB9869_35095 [Verrucomicrobiia bacterium]